LRRFYDRPAEDNICWAAALGALERCGRWQEALQLLLRMLDLFVRSYLGLSIFNIVDLKGGIFVAIFMGIFSDVF